MQLSKNSPITVARQCNNLGSVVIQLFFIASPLLWNSIPFGILSQPAAPTFKYKLKHLLFSTKAFYAVVILSFDCDCILFCFCFLVCVYVYMFVYCDVL